MSATPGAVRLLEQLKVKHGPLMVFQSGGCCDGSSPIVLKDGELPISPTDVQLGSVAGVPFWVDGEQFRRWQEPEFVLDVSEGAAEGFALSLPDEHLITRAPD